MERAGGAGEFPEITERDWTWHQLSKRLQGTDWKSGSFSQNATTDVHVCALVLTRWNAFLQSASCSLTHTHTLAAAIYSHLSHTGKCIHVPQAPISLLCLSIFSLTHSPKQSLSITPPLTFFASLLLCLSLPPISHFFPPLLIFLCYNTSLSHRLFTSLSFFASHARPGVLSGDQSSSSQRWVKPKHTHGGAHTFTVTSGQQMPRFTYDHNGEQSQLAKRTHARM